MTDHGNGRYHAGTIPPTPTFSLATVAFQQVGVADTLIQVAPHHYQVRVPPAQLIAFYDTLRAHYPLRLLTMVGLDRRVDLGIWQIRTLWGMAHGAQSLEVVTDLAATPDPPQIPSITPLFPAANWYEREIRDLFGIIPVGHPDPRHLVVHPNWPATVYPLRQEYDRATFPPYARNDEHFHNRTSGEGVMEIPVGPIHAGVIEPGHFRFSAVGEVVVNLEARFFFTHRGVEKHLEGMDAARACYVVERTCAACTVASTLAYCQALEEIAGCVIPPRAAYLRVIWAELERLYNHIGDTGNLCAGIGFHAGTQQGAYLKEILLDLNERLVGSRYLFGVVRPGGVGVDLAADATGTLRATLAMVRPRYQRLVRTILGNTGVVDRFTGTGRVFERTARELGAVGVAARASGVDTDVRRDAPYAAYAHLGSLTVPTQTPGDVFARLKIRVAEVAESFRLIAAALDQLPTGAVKARLGALPAGASGYGVTESARGATCHWVLIGPNQTLARVRLRTASYANWPLVPRAVLNNIIPDFPLINKSFELCYSCLDR
jgi:Ni,Fe-hydrogenase III large subunit/Ni,Fe-hydrogenase III component G